MNLTPPVHKYLIFDTVKLCLLHFIHTVRRQLSLCEKCVFFFGNLELF